MVYLNPVTSCVSSSLTKSVVVLSLLCQNKELMWSLIKKLTHWHTGAEQLKTSSRLAGSTPRIKSNPTPLTPNLEHLALWENHLGIGLIWVTVCFHALGSLYLDFFNVLPLQLEHPPFPSKKRVRKSNFLDILRLSTDSVWYGKGNKYDKFAGKYPLLKIFKDTLSNKTGGLK